MLNITVIGNLTAMQNSINIAIGKIDALQNNINTDFDRMVKEVDWLYDRNKNSWMGIIP